MSRSDRLQKIADALGVPIDELDRWHDEMADIDGLEFLLDREGQRIVKAFAGLQVPDQRRAIADTVVAIASAMAVKRAAAS